MNISWIEPLAATFALPLIFMAGDYVLRVRTNAASLDEIAHLVGGDCCLLSLGASGSIFNDEKLKHISGLNSGITLAFVIGVVVLLRYFCFTVPTGYPKSKQVRVSIFCGLFSIALLSVIIVAGYVFG